MKKGNLSGLKWQERFDYVKNVTFNEDDFKTKGSKFQIVKFPAGKQVDPHFHKTKVEVFYVVKGQGIIKINDQEFRCQPDDFFLIERGDVHQIINDTDEDFIMLVFRTNEIQEDLHWQNEE